MHSLIWSQPSMASILTSASLTLSNQQESTLSNQTLEFVTPSGVDAPTDTIVLEYESGFDLSLLTFADFDLAEDDDSACDGPFSDKTLAASAAAGTWGVGVSGQLITLTAPTDAGGSEISAGRCVQIQIGTNAAGGSEQTTNPAIAGSYEVDVYGLFGDHAMYAVGIQDSTAFNVGATVNVTTGGGDPPIITPPGDTTAPTITNIVVSNITTTSATVSWETDEAAETELFYGLDTSYTETSLPDTLYRTVHTRSLGGLTEATLYHFQIWASDNSGNPTTSSDLTFTTLDTTAPIITNLQVTSITETTATVSWDTDELSDTEVVGSFGTITDGTMVLTHSVNLTGLTPGTLYPIDVFSSDASANDATDSTSFTTLIDLPPTNVVGFVAAAGDEQVGLTWTNPPDLDFASVSLRFKLGSAPTSITDGTEIYSGTDSSYLHTALTNGTEYFYTIFAIDAGGNVSSGASDSATPVGTAPPIIVTPTTSLTISNLQVTSITQTSATVTWVTSRAADSTAVIVGIGTFSDTPLVINHSLPLSGLLANTTYALVASSTDAAASVASANTSFTTLADGVIPPTAPGDDDDDDGGGGEDDDDDDDDDDIVVGEDDDDDVVVIPDEDTPPVPSVLIPRTEVEFLVARDAIALTPSVENEVRVLGGRGLSVNLDLVNAPADIVSVQLSVGNSGYLMNQETSIVASTDGELVEVEDNQMYSARVITPNVGTSLQININYITGETQVLDYVLEVKPEGSVRDKNEGTLLDDAVVTLFAQGGGPNIWNAIPYAQTNPLTTGESGTYAWYVPNGTYTLELRRDGYNALSSTKITIAGNIVNAPFELIELLPPLSEEIETIADVLPALTRRAVNSVQIVRQNAAAQESADVAAPIVAFTAVSTVTMLATSFNAIRFLQYLFTAPFLLLKRRRRKKWGVVYDSLRKVPVDLAIVRLIDVATNRIVKSQVTDKAGRFIFVVDTGVYKIEVRKDGFTFPSDHLSGLKVDGDFLDLYHGENIEVNEMSSAISVNVPADPVGQEIAASKKGLLATWTRRFMYVFSVVGAIVAMIVAVIDPSWWTIGLAVVQVVVLGLFIKLAIPQKPTSWGIVYDEKTHRPLAKAIVRIFNLKYNKL
ncbi:hypothetical protein HOI83_03260, partial [Candidatus Uhrbacteria bacterium]|nr:hypothetical protein [Candidatus Uhrbacteria bacterium]